jgi:non-ribosomal peptide synthetase component F
VPQPRGAAVPLSFSQERLWFLDQLQPGQTAYNQPAALRLDGALDVAALEASLTELVRRHEVLRTRFEIVGGEAAQRIDPPAPFRLPVTDLSGPCGGPARGGGGAAGGEEAARPFDLSAGPMLRARLLRLGGEEHVLLATMHHIVSDGWSMSVMTREIGALYAAFAAGAASPLPELALQYADYALWQRSWLDGEAMERQLGYWRERLADAPPVLELPTDRPRPAEPSGRGGEVPFAVPAALTGRLQALARSEGATLYMVLLAAYQAVLSRWSGQDEVVVGSPVAGRSHRALEPLIGFFVNNLAMRTDLSGDPSFRALLGRVREGALQAYAHQDVPFEKLVAELQPARDLARHPLFQATLTLQNTPEAAMVLPGLAMAMLPAAQPPAATVDLSLYVEEKEGGLSGSLVYAADLFDADTIRRFCAHLVRFLGEVADDADRPVGAVALIDAGERRRLLEEWNDTARDYPRGLCVHQLVAGQAARTPDAPAVVAEAGALSYGELDRRANRLARHLQAQGVGPDAIVGLCLPRTADMVVAILGILKAGAAYLPLDPDYPAERIAFMLSDAQVPVLVTSEAIDEDLPAYWGRTVLIDADWPRIAAQEESAPDCAAAPDSLAYVIYTSGSTGTPKGVMLSHRGLANLAFAQAEIFGAGPGDRVLQFARLGFDAAVWEVAMALTAGAALHLAPPRRFGRAAAWPSCSPRAASPSPPCRPRRWRSCAPQTRRRCAPSSSRAKPARPSLPRPGRAGSASSTPTGRARRRCARRWRAGLAAKARRRSAARSRTPASMSWTAAGSRCRWGLRASCTLPARVWRGAIWAAPNSPPRSSSPIRSGRRGRACTAAATGCAGAPTGRSSSSAGSTAR